MNNAAYTTAIRGILDAAYADAQFLRAESATSGARLALLHDNAAVLTERNVKLQQVIDQLHREVQSHKASIVKQSQRCEQASQFYVRLHEEYRSLKGRGQALVAESTAKEREKTLLEQQVTSTKTEVEALRAEVASKQEAHNRLAQAIRQQQTDVQQLHAQMGEAKMVLEQHKRSEREQLTATAQLGDRLTSLRAELARLERDRDSALTRLEAARAALQSIKAQESALQESRAQIERDYSVLLAQSRSLEEQASTAQDATQAAARELDGARRKADEQRTVVDGLQARIASLKDKHASLTEARRRADEEAGRAAQEGASSRAVVEDLTKRVAEAQKDLSAAEARAKEAKGGAAAIQAQQTRLQGQLDGLTSARQAAPLAPAPQQPAVAYVPPEASKGAPAKAVQQDDDEDEDVTIGALRAAQRSGARTGSSGGASTAGPLGQDAHPTSEPSPASATVLPTAPTAAYAVPSAARAPAAGADTAGPVRGRQAARKPVPKRGRVQSSEGRSANKDDKGHAAPPPAPASKRGRGGSSNPGKVSPVATTAAPVPRPTPAAAPVNMVPPATGQGKAQAGKGPVSKTGIIKPVSFPAPAAPAVPTSATPASSGSASSTSSSSGSSDDDGLFGDVGLGLGFSLARAAQGPKNTSKAAGSMSGLAGPRKALAPALSGKANGYGPLPSAKAAMTAAGKGAQIVEDEDDPGMGEDEDGEDMFEDITL